ncbi:hypothetical protein NADFUDRAFT_53579 [Nadsonia fulvescens var. elongata DSM 6958]|uniref:RRN7-type domain-containing protein n=1 Tax=Nadsonia fulvescens var. elongata DSM 6958 TaxID=857566 RepID=A0A1E3PCZ2_9ASCO|nr:hypothetical protein NADFUDRAFT_53579 [Nadsonia fulvescens var. elongata DSM 6958]
MSSITYKRGPRCGLKNCPSTLWRVLDGQRVCQYGHIKEGDLEIAEEDDDAFLNLGRKINVPGLGSYSSAIGVIKGDDEGVWYGKEGNALYMQCLQLILRTQVRWLIEKQGIRPELEGVVKDLWSLYISRSNFAKTKFEHEDSDQDNAEEDSNVDRGHDDLLDAANPFYTDEDDTIANETPRVKSSDPKRLVVIELAQLIDMPVLCYLGCLMIRAPVYICDFHRWIQQFQFPHMKSLRLIPKEMREHLAGGYHNALTPMRIPRSGELLTEVRKLLIYFHGTYKIKFPKPLFQPLLVKVLRGLFLPVELYLAVEKLIGILEIDLEIPLTSDVKANQIWPETQIVALVIFCVKLCYGFDDLRRTPSGESPSENVPEASEMAEATESYITPEISSAKIQPIIELAAYSPDWNLWMDMVRKVWIEDESLGEVDEKELPFWTPVQIDRYLDWFEDNFVEPDATTESALKQRGKKANQAMSLKRLLDLFPTELGDESARGSNTKQKFRKRKCSRSQDNESMNYTAPETLSEIGQIITATTQIKAKVLAETQSKPAKKTKTKTINQSQNSLNLTPGARYPIYTAAVMRMPTALEILFQSAEKMTAISVPVLRGSVVGIERRCKKYLQR